MMAAGGAVFVFNWWRIIREGYHLQRMFNANPGAGVGSTLSGRWRYFLVKGLYGFLGFGLLLAGVLIKNG